VEIDRPRARCSGPSTGLSPGGVVSGAWLRVDPCRPVLGTRLCPPDLGGSPIPSRFVTSVALGAVNGSGHLRAGRMGAPPTPPKAPRTTPPGLSPVEGRNDGHATPRLNSPPNFVGELSDGNKLGVAPLGDGGIFLSGPLVGSAAHHRAARVSVGVRERLVGATERPRQEDPSISQRGGPTV